MKCKLILIMPLALALSIWMGGWSDAYSSSSPSAMNILHPIVVELFTSQGCSSCPPADRFLNDLGQHKNVIALSCHVTYWDYLGWKDPLAQEFCTKRQRASAAQRKTKRVFTPEMLVNGTGSYVGSHRGQVSNALEKEKYLQPIEIMRIGDATIIAKLPELPRDNYLTYTVWVFGTKDIHNQMIKRGENKGKTVTYKHSVIAMQKYAGWNGKSEARSITIPNDPNVDSLTVIAQAHGHGPIVAAGKLRLK